MDSDKAALWRPDAKPGAVWARVFSWLGVSVAAGLAVLLLMPSERAYADCSPTAPINNTAVTCTGTTTDQNAPTGYGTFTDTGNTITVVPGASVTGTAFGIVFSNGTVINSGAISGGSLGIYAGTGDANVTNSGTISGGGDGIYANIGNASVTNSGTISGGSYGIFGGINANVINTGTITGDNYGVSSGSHDANVTNTGTISGGAFGINAGRNANVTNSGTVSGGTFGIFSNNDATITNSGAITGGSYGISVLHNSTITNSGTIAGVNYGILAGGGTANITNAGTISGHTALLFIGTADTLTLLTGSKIIGAINLGTGDTVNFQAGNQNLTFNTLAGATVTGTVPFAVLGNQVATVDPTQFAANGRVLGDFTRSASQVVPDFGNQPAATTGGPIGYAAATSSPASVVSSAFDNMPGRDAYAADQAVFKAPTVVQADGTAIWARGFGGYRVQQGDGGVLLRTSSTFLGGALGVERQVRSDLRVGVFAGAGTTRSTIDLNFGNTDSNLGFGGVYARYFRGASFLYAAVQGGGSHNDTTRNINNNLLAGGLESAKGSYSGWYVSPELKLGTNVALGRVMDSQYTLTPSIGVRYLYGSFGGYTETGSTANLTVNSQTAQTLEERAELKLTRATTFDARNALLLEVTGGALGIQRVGSNIVSAALLGQSIPFATPGKDDVWGGFGGAGMEWRTGSVALFASGEYLWLSDSSTVVSGKGGVRVAF